MVFSPCLALLLQKLAIVDFKIFKFLTVGTVKRDQVLHRAKFRQNRSNHG